MSHAEGVGLGTEKQEDRLREGSATPLEHPRGLNKRRFCLHFPFTALQSRASTRRWATTLRARALRL